MRITLRQTSPESESIYDFIIELYKASNGDWKFLQKKAGISDEELKYFLEYAAMFLGNSGNYKSFGDSKFLPRGDEKAFDALATVSPQANEYYKATKGAIFSSDNSGIMHLGYPDGGHMSTYYPDSKEITKADIGAVSDFLEKKGLLVVSCHVSFWDIQTFLHRSDIM
jgi:dipeptidyl-peptidase-3